MSYWNMFETCVYVNERYRLMMSYWNTVNERYRLMMSYWNVVCMLMRDIDWWCLIEHVCMLMRDIDWMMTYWTMFVC